MIRRRRDQEDHGGQDIVPPIDVGLFLFVDFLIDLLDLDPDKKHFQLAMTSSGGSLNPT
jgi:hypothetical protein